MRTYITTVFSHFGAIRFKKYCEKMDWKARVMPVPRSLSSSCGTCVRFECTMYQCEEEMPEEIEQVVEVIGDRYLTIYKAENS